MRERITGALEGIQHLSESGEGLHGRHGSIAMARSLLDNVCTSPESVVEWLPTPEPASVGEDGPGGTNATGVDQDIQVLDLMRHMRKACLNSVNQCDELVRLILQSADTYANNESEQTGKWVLSRLGEMNDAPLTLSPHGSGHTSASERLKKLISAAGQDVFSNTGELSKQRGAYALWGKSTGEDPKSAILDLLKGSS